MQPKIIRLFLRDLYQKITLMTYNYFETILSNENKTIDISSIQQIMNYVLIIILISLYAIGLNWSAKKVKIILIVLSPYTHSRMRVWGEKLKSWGSVLLHAFANACKERTRELDFSLSPHTRIRECV